MQARSTTSCAPYYKMREFLVFFFFSALLEKGKQILFFSFKAPFSHIVTIKDVHPTGDCVCTRIKTLFNIIKIKIDHIFHIKLTYNKLRI